MSDPSSTTESKQKMPLLKSKKELVALVVSAVIFAIVIYMMYFGKSEAAPPAGAGEVVDTALPVATPAQAAQAAPAAAPLSLQAILASLNSEPGADRTAAPAKLTRSPFDMSLELRRLIYNIKSDPVPNKASSAPVVLTRQNARSVLAQIPGAERAAAEGLTLDAVMTTSTWKGASINGEIIPLGDTVLGFKLTEILEDRATLQLGEHRISLLVRPTHDPRSANGKNQTRTWRLPK